MVLGKQATIGDMPHATSDSVRMPSLYHLLYRPRTVTDVRCQKLLVDLYHSKENLLVANVYNGLEASTTPGVSIRIMLEITEAILAS